VNSFICGNLSITNWFHLYKWDRSTAVFWILIHTPQTWIAEATMLFAQFEKKT